MANPESSLFRNRFHLSPPRGWMNDPNGFSLFENRYHLFYQYNPRDTVWGPMHWGHAVSPDLLDWTDLPIALTPDSEYDADGCFSGSALTIDGKHALFYTGHLDPHPSVPGSRRETQCLAIGDGSRYIKDPANPVIDERQLPSGLPSGDFRDPKVWRDGDRWLCIAVHRHSDGFGQILLFESDDLRSWSLVGPVLRNRGELGGMWECPDFFRLEDKEVLVWSVMNPAHQGTGFRNLHGAVWATGVLDRGTGIFTEETRTEIDKGPDFYAPQTVATPDGRVVMIAWMQMWERSSPSRELGLDWTGCMTLPREVFMNGGRLCQRPIRELERYRGPCRSASSRVEGVVAFPELEGQCLDLEVVLGSGTASRCGLLLYLGDGERTLLEWDRAGGIFTLDRSKSGHPIRNLTAGTPECQVYRAVTGTADELRLRIVLDRSALEIFLQDGEIAMACTLFPKETSRGIRAFAEEGFIECSLKWWNLDGHPGAAQ